MTRHDSFASGIVPGVLCGLGILIGVLSERCNSAETRTQLASSLAVEKTCQEARHAAMIAQLDALGRSTRPTVPIVEPPRLDWDEIDPDRGNAIPKIRRASVRAEFELERFVRLCEQRHTCESADEQTETGDP